MLLRLTEICLTLDEDEAMLSEKASERLGLEPSGIRTLRIVRKALDARKKDRIRFVYTLDLEVDDAAENMIPADRRPIRIIEEEKPVKFTKLKNEKRLVIIGAGPAGLFAALRLTEYGLKPLILERGKEIGKRIKDVEQFWKERKLNPESNVQFGEGGAGTFSDGKLTTRVDDPRISYILQAFVNTGADPEILYQARPHLGTDRLRGIIVNLRKLLIERGCEVRFESRADGFNIRKGKIVSVVINEGEEVKTDHLILAIGHSARDTYEILCRAGVEMTAKAFAVGVRAEHPQKMIDRIQYGGAAGHPKLPPAEYVLSHNMKERERSAYSFCMCPGGSVIAASSEPGAIVTNGMSLSRRDSPYANSALIVTVSPEDFGEGPLAGVAFQRKWEKLAFEFGGGDYNAPAQNMMAFFDPGREVPLHRSSFLPGLSEAPLENCLPDYVIDSLREALPVFDRKMRGFISEEATLIGVETRTSAPLRITRAADFQSTNTRGLYPCGEGAGYAGGIMSSALDGIKVADAIAAASDRSSG